MNSAQLIQIIVAIALAPITILRLISLVIQAAIRYREATLITILLLVSMSYISRELEMKRLRSDLKKLHWKLEEIQKLKRKLEEENQRHRKELEKLKRKIEDMNPKDFEKYIYLTNKIDDSHDEKFEF